MLIYHQGQLCISTVLTLTNLGGFMPEEKKYGIENVWTVISLILEGGNVAGEVVAMEGEVKWYQRFLFPLGKVGDEIIAMFSVDYKSVLPEFNDIDEEEKAELLRRAQEKFDIPQDKVEQVVESCFVVAFKLGDIVKEIMGIVDTYKKN